MRVLLVHSAYQQFGGEDSVVRAETELLRKHADEVYHYSRHNDEIKQFGLTEKAAFLPQTIYSWKTSGELEDVVRGFRPDVAFIHNVYPLISPSGYHKLHSLGIPTLQVLHNFRLHCPNGLFYTQGQICEACKGGDYLNAVRKRCYKDSYAFSGLYAATLGLNRVGGVIDKISGFICLTEFFKSKMQEMGVPESKLFVRPNFVYAPPLPAGKMPGDYVLFMGRLSPEKGCWTLIRAFEQLPLVRLKILGTGPLEQEFRQYVQQKGIRNIEMLGFKSGSEKWEILRNARCLAMPSEWYENFPVTALEAFMACKPIIAARLGGLPYIVEEGKSGLLFEAGNVSELAQKIQWLVDRPDEAVRMGECGRRLTETKYGPEQGYRNLMKIFEQVISAQAQAA
ncbi:MAG TPA: glycosyltransferase family 4 protein [Candidatus Sulfotelmatobacter sp.]|jgi:glycosyltransferase involved in cell wall biosynthesis